MIENQTEELSASRTRRAKILIISYLFPPAGGIPVQRALSLVRYLPDLGFEVHVLQAANAATPVRDPALCQRIPGEVQVHSAFTPEIPFWIRHAAWNWLSGSKKGGAARVAPAESRRSRARGPRAWITGLVRRILSPEPEILWYPFALRKATRIIRDHGIEVVLVTAPPFSAFVVGNSIKRRFPRIRYVADFRDEWISFYLKDFDFQNDDRTRQRAIQIERTTIESADLVVAVAESSLATIRARYPEQRAEKFTCVSNGFDPEAFADFCCSENHERKLIVTHLGTAYKTASPQYYLDAVDELPPDLASSIETRFIGRITEGERHQLENRRSSVQVLGFLPQSDALTYVEETDCLLLTMTNDISLPGKLYEYLASRKPIIALSPAGSEVDRFMRETKAGWSLEYRDPTSIRLLLSDLARQKKKTGRLSFPGASPEIVARYSRPVLVSKYAGNINRLLPRS